mgnify:CR=1 FL=1
MNEGEPPDEGPKPLLPNIFDAGCATGGCMVIGTLVIVAVIAEMVKGIGRWVFDASNPMNYFIALVVVALAAGWWMWRR